MLSRIAEGPCDGRSSTNAGSTSSSIGGGIVGAGIAAHAAADRSRGCPRRSGRLRRRDLERLVEADPRRPPVPPSRRRPPRTRGTPRASRADRTSSRRTSSTARRSSCRSTRAARSARVRPERDPALLRARPLAAQLARPARRGRARWCPRSATRRPPLVRALRRRVDERRAALPRERRAAAEQARPSRTRAGRRARRRGGRVVGAQVQSTARRVAVRARVVVNATGPWVDAVRRLEDASAGQSVRLSKGVHVLVPNDGSVGGGVDRPAGRRPRHVRGSLVRDVPARDDRHGVRRRPAAVAVDPADVDQVLAEARVALGPEFAAPAGCAPRSQASACSRPAPARARAPGARRSSRRARRDAQRRGRQADDLPQDRARRSRVSDRARHPRLDRRPWPLPDAPPERRRRLPAELPPDVASHLIHLYGSRAPDVLRRARRSRAPRAAPRRRPGLVAQARTRVGRNGR